MTRRVALLGVALLLAVTVDASATAPAAPRFQAFEARADSYGIETSAKLLVALPLPVESFTTRTRASIGSQPSAVAYAGVVDVPLGELLGFYNVPATLPTYCYAQYPGEPDATCGPGKVHAAGDGYDYDATAAESSVAGADHDEGGVLVGASRSHSLTHIVDGVLQSETEIVLHDIDLGGVLQIEQLRATASTSTAGTPGSADGEATLTASGVTVAGNRIAVPEALDVATLVAEVVGPFADQLRTSGIEVHAVSPPTVVLSPDGTDARAVVDGMEVSTIEATTGNRVTYRLAVARSSANAVPAAASLPVVEPSASPTAASPPPSGPLAAATQAPPDAPAPAAITQMGSPVTSAGVATPTAALRPTLVAESLDPRIADWFGRLYLALAATVLVLGAAALHPRHRWRQRVR